MTLQTAPHPFPERSEPEIQGRLDVLFALAGGCAQAKVTEAGNRMGGSAGNDVACGAGGIVNPAAEVFVVSAQGGTAERLQANDLANEGNHTPSWDDWQIPPVPIVY